MKKQKGKLEQMEECLFCSKEMESVCEGQFQPYGGGEIRMIFCYGSKKYDLYPETTSFVACVCDDCASKYVDRMKINPSGRNRC